MTLLLKEQRLKLRENSQRQAAAIEDEAAAAYDPFPVVKLFTPFANATWLLTELDADNIAFALCDLGLGFPELGYVSLDELAAGKGLFKVERDRFFTPDRPISHYAADAARAGYIPA